MKRVRHSQNFSVHLGSRYLLSAILCLLIVSIAFLPQRSNAAVAKLISFQGKITNASSGTNVADGNYSMQFKIYNVASGGTALWTETWDGLSGTTQVAVANGVFSVKLGTYSDLSVIDFTTTPLYLGVNFNPGTGYDGEMSPRKQLTASAYALNANNLSGDGRIGLAYAPSTTTYNAANISYSPSVASTQSAMVLTSGANVSGATLNVVQSGTGGAILIGSTALGGATQTYIGANPGSFSGNFEDFQIGGSSKFKIDASGNVTNAGTLLSAGNITSNGTLTATTSLNLKGATSGTVTIAAQAAAGTYTLTLPNTAGSLNQVLQTDGSGNLSWATVSGGSGARWDQITAPTANLALSMGSFTTAFNYGAATGASNMFSITDTASNTGTGALVKISTQLNSTANPLVVDAGGPSSQISYHPSFQVDSLGDVIVGNDLQFVPVGGGSSNVTIQASISTASAYILTLPTTAGTNGQVLTTDGSGTLSWTTAAGGSTRWDQLQAPSASLSLTMGANTTSLAFSSITTGTGFTMSGGTAQTTGTVLSVGSATYVHTAAETGSLSKLTVTDASTIASGTSVTNGLIINSTFNTASGAGTRQLNGIRIPAPTFTACSAGNCNWVGLNISVPTTSATGMTAQGLAISASGVPKTDLMNISNAGQGVTTAGVNDLSLTYVGGAAAVESGAMRIDLTPGGTSGGAWNGFRFVANATGPASGVTETGLKLEGPTAGGAGTYNAINVSSILPTTNGTANGLNITGSTAAAGTENGINIANLTAGAGTETAVKIGTGWDYALDIGGLTTTATVSGYIKFARSGTTTTTCAGASAQGIVFKNDAGTQVAHFCADGTGGMKLYYNAATASSTDVAENYSDPTNVLSAGDVVALSASGVKAVVPSSGRYDSMVIGVVSTEPGLLLSDINETNKVTDLVNPKPIALIGRVPTKVSTENGVIHTGDYLVASSVPGVAMKATKAGDTIGRALEDYTDTTQSGKILAFIRHGFFEGKQDGTDSNNDSEIYTDKVTAAVEVDTAKLAADALEIHNESLLSGGIKVDTISSINDLITFKNDVEFIGRPYFNSDTAGFAVIRKGSKTVDVTFDQEYLGQPIVSAMISQEQSNNFRADDQAVQAILSGDMKYLVRNKSTKGFTIQLNTAAPEDMTFSWIALAVKNPKLFDSANQQTMQTQQATQVQSSPQNPALESASVTSDNGSASSNTVSDNSVIQSAPTN